MGLDNRSVITETFMRRSTPDSLGRIRSRRASSHLCFFAVKRPIGCSFPSLENAWNLEKRPYTRSIPGNATNTSAGWHQPELICAITASWSCAIRQIPICMAACSTKTGSWL